MPLINCPECKKQISDQTPSCPFCGYPINEKKAAPKTQVITIQATSKKWKACQLIGTLLCIAGVISCSISVSENKPDPSPFMTVYWLTGITFFIIGRFGAWWSNK